MERRPATAARGRGTQTWRRGGGGGSGSGSGGNEGSGGGRGRGGGHNRGRGKRDHYRGRARGGGPHAGFQHRGPDDGNGVELEDDGIEETFSRRKLESNWDRYAESEREEAADDDTPTQRGTDYHVLLESAGDSFTQFRFSEEKDWEMDSLAASQMSAVFVDLPALAQSLQEMPLHQRLNLEAELVQVSTPVELPILTMPPKQDLGGMAASFAPPASAFKRLNTNQGVYQITSPSPQDSCIAAEPPVDNGDEELDQLLGLEKPLSASSGAQPVSIVDEETSAPEQVNTEMQESPLSHSQQCAAAEPDEVVETVPEDVASPSKAAPVKREEDVALPSKAAPVKREEDVALPSKAAPVKREEDVALPSKAAPVKREEDVASPSKAAPVKREEDVALPSKAAPVKREEDVALPSKAAPVKREEDVAPPSKAAPVKREEDVAPPSKAAPVKREEDVAPTSEATPVKQEMTEDDLEDWLDSMIS